MGRPYHCECRQTRGSAQGDAVTKDEAIQLIESKPVYIYALVDPRDMKIRYIGRSSQPNARRSTHICDSRSLTGAYAKSVKSIWLRELTAEGKRPILQIVQRCNAYTELETEAYWIDVFKSTLLNKRFTKDTGCGLRLPQDVVSGMEDKDLIEVIRHFYPDSNHCSYRTSQLPPIEEWIDEFCASLEAS